MAYKLNGESTTKSSECEERQRLRAEEVVTSRDNAKLLNDDGNLELFKEAVKLTQQEQVQNSTVEHFVAVTVPRLRPRSSMTQVRTKRSGRHVTKRRTSRKRVTRKIKKPVINVKPKRSSQSKERRQSRRKLKTKLKNGLSTISTAMEVKGQEMMRIRKHVNLTVQGGREVPRQGRSERVEDRESTSAVRCEEEEVSSHG